MTPQTLAAIRILALVAAYRERFGDDETMALLIGLVRRVETDRVTVTGVCAICGVAITQKSRGRRRKFCAACVAGLGHLSIPMHTRKMARKKLQGDN